LGLKRLGLRFCFGRASVNIPSSFMSIEYSVFLGYSGLVSVVISSDVTIIEYKAFFGCASLASVNIPASVAYIGKRAFSECASLTTIELSRRTRIDGSAFDDVRDSLQYRD
jgi:hypothetical protein